MTDKLFPLAFVVLWSSAFVSSKFIVQDATPFAALCLRFAIVAAGYAAYAAVCRESLRIAKQDAAHAFLIGALFHGVYLGGVFFAISRGMPAGLAALIVTLQPVLTVLLARPLLGEQASARQWCGIGLGLGGVVLVLGLDLPERLPESASVAIVAALLAITAGTLWQKKMGSRISLTASNFYQAVSAALFHAAAIALLERSPAINFTTQFILAMGWQILFVSFGAFTLLTYLIKIGSASKTAALFFLVPGVSILLAWAAAGETLSSLGIVGLLVSSAGVYLARQGQKQP